MRLGQLQREAVLACHVDKRSATTSNKGRPVDLKVPITITDELSDEVISGTALLNLASGEIHRVEYQDYDVDVRGLPWESEDYEFTSGMLSNAGKDVEFGVQVNRTSGQYSVSANELLEIKVRAAALFAGVSGKEMVATLDSKLGQASAPVGKTKRPLH
jgi:hypothetical protein